MALFLSENNVKNLLSMSDAIETVTKVFHLSGQREVINPPRQCIPLPNGTLRLTAAVVPSMERMAVKVSSTLIFKNNSGWILLLLDSKTGKILSLIEVFHLGTLRTGAATGVAITLWLALTLGASGYLAPVGKLELSFSP